MHLAAAVRAPVVAVFGPSMPVRYAPRGTAHRVVRVDLWCAPCNMIRKPPARCQGHTPDCLTGVTVDAVTAAALSLVAETEAAPGVIGRLAIERAGRLDTIDLDEYGAGAIADEAAGRANAWIKGLRHVDVAGRSLRDRFHYRGDSLWWFAELFLHKEGVVDTLWRTALTLDALCEVEQPTRDRRRRRRSGRCGSLLPQVAARLGIGLLPGTDVGRGAAAARNTATGVKSRLLTWAAEARRALPIGRPRAGDRRHAGLRAQRVLARRHRRGRLHRADPRRARRHQRGADPAVGVGPRHNFQARRWWHPLTPGWRQPRADGAIVPVEALASRAALAGSRAVWHGAARRRRRADRQRRAAGGGRHRRLRRLGADRARAAGHRHAAVPVVGPRHGRSRRRMERARPRLVLTYAEAGGWGRAIMLEARRRGIPSPASSTASSTAGGSTTCTSATRCSRRPRSRPIAAFRGPI